MEPNLPIVELVKRAQKGDSEAQKRVLEIVLPYARKAVFRVLGHSQDLDDLTQQSLIEIARSLKSFKHHSAVTSWAYRIGTHTAIQFLRRQNKIIPMDVLPDKGQTQSYASAIDAQDLLKRLPHNLRVTLILREIEGYTSKEIAEMMGVAEGTVYYRISEARKILVEYAQTIKKEAM